MIDGLTFLCDKKFPRYGEELARTIRDKNPPEALERYHGILSRPLPVYTYRDEGLQGFVSLPLYGIEEGDLMRIGYFRWWLPENLVDQFPLGESLI